MSWCYLIHFDQPLRAQSKSARAPQHYLGYTADIKSRWAQHLTGQGSNLTKLAFMREIGMTLVRVWPNASKHTELYLKHQGGKALCPICQRTTVEELLSEGDHNE